jgi:hypothetical protein
MATYEVADPQKYFFLHEGGELKSLEELFIELQAMEPRVWEHHVNAERNDFANWVRDVMGDRYLAHKISNVTAKDDLLKLLFINFFR